MQAGIGGVRYTGTVAGLAVVFLVALLFPPTAPAAFYNGARDCFNLNQPGEVIPAPEGSPYEIHLLGNGVPRQKGVNLQADLAARDVANRLYSALGGIFPRGYPPRRLPLFVTSQAFDTDGNAGLVTSTCADAGVFAAAVRSDVSRQELASTAAHELFHAFSGGVPPAERDLETWWEEASASYAEWRLGFSEPNGWNQWLERPELPLDSTQGEHEYAMWRFVRLLEARGRMGGGAGDWSLIRDVIPGYTTPGATPALVQHLAARGTTLGDELAAFWGDRILQRPTTGGPAISPTDAQLTRIKPGRRTIKTSAKPLGTWFNQFMVAGNVARVEFEFEPRNATEGIFWGAPTREDSQRFASGETIAFCTEGATGSELHLPSRGFPVTFTNGATSGRPLRSEIDVFAQHDADQCRDSDAALGNRACSILSQAGVADLFGTGKFPFFRHEDGVWHCVFVNNLETRGVDLLINRVDRDENLAKLRRGLRRGLVESGYTLIPDGDVAGITTIVTEDSTTQVILMLVGRDLNAISVNGTEFEARRLTGRIAGIEE